MKAAIALISVLLVLSLAVPVQAELVGETFGVVLTTQAPYPAEPGKNVNIEVEIQNTGQSEASDVVFEISPEDPFTLLPGEDKIKTFNRISAQSSVKTSYNLLVSPDALTNEYELEFRIYKGALATGYQSKTISVNVFGTPELVLDEITTPDKMEPGGTATLSIGIRNIGSGTARHLKLSFNSTAELIPILSKGSIYLGDLGPEDVKAADIELSIDSSAEEKTYTASLMAAYEDEAGQDGSKSFTIGVPVRGTILLEVIDIEADFRREKMNIDVANKGTTEAKALEAKLIVDDKIVDIDYTSSLKAHKKTTFTFPLILVGSGTLEISYIGPGLEKNNVTKDVSMAFVTPGADGTTATAVVIILIIILGYYFWRRRSKKKRKGTL